MSVHLSIASLSQMHTSDWEVEQKPGVFVGGGGGGETEPRAGKHNAFLCDFFLGYILVFLNEN